ncbi:MAG TPA: amidohydrolase family protein [Candidatus Acidoferrales bacterium]|nr:amidohydrolase family protein [Candidatus Acidoferrales bacterium]
MLSRRGILIAAGAAGVAALVRPVTTVFAHASQPSTTVNFAVPADACDCHTHIFGDPRRFPFAPTRVYTPETASIAETRALHKALHISRIVVVQPTVYGTDNSCTIDAIKQLSPNSRGAVMVDDNITDAALADMDHAGIRAIRINLETVGQTDPSASRRRLQAAVDKIKGSKWHIEVYTRLSVIEALKDQVQASPVPVSFDHFGGAQAALGVQQPGFATLLDLLRSGNTYVKISAAYRASTEAPDYPDVAPLAKALIAANPQRILWGTDWPHPAQIKGRKATEITPLWQIDDGRIFNLLPEWAPNPELRKTILVENPARLYGF